jgi:PhnB protein
MPTKPIPDGYHTITPYLFVENVPKLIEFLSKAFDAKEIIRQGRADGSTAHAEMRIGDSPVMMGEPMGQFGPMPASIYMYVADCDAVYRRAVDAGGVSVIEPTTMNFSGQRYGGIKDPAGNLWWIATNVEDVSKEEMDRRFAEWQKAKATGK